MHPKFEERLLNLLLAQMIKPQLAAIHFGNRKKECPVFPFRAAQLRLRPHVDGLEPRLRFVARRAHIDTDAAPSAVLGRNLQCVLESLPFRKARVMRFEGFRCVCEHRWFVRLATDHAVRADDHTLSALNADVWVPNGNFPG